VQSYIIAAFRYPENPRFSFEKFYLELSQRGFIIYPGKLTEVNTFRIGTIGRLFPCELQQLVDAIRAILR
jgi:2-aminoethylphosphonate-pyruvate transaminase